jgi:hypothetical protein
MECLASLQDDLPLYGKPSIHIRVLGLQRAANCRTNPLFTGELQTNQQLNHLHYTNLEPRRLEEPPVPKGNDRHSYRRLRAGRQLGGGSRKSPDLTGKSIGSSVHGPQGKARRLGTRPAVAHEPQHCGINLGNENRDLSAVGADVRAGPAMYGPGVPIDNDPGPFDGNDC